MTEVRAAELPAVARSPGIVQGAYGDAGNLELVVPAVGEGWWVFWFNADTVEHRAGAAVGRWSGGLHVTGPPTRSVRIAQLEAGPRFLEVLAVTDTGLRRHCWTPAAGFLDAELVVAGIRHSSRVVEADRLHALAVDASGCLVHLSAALDSYPTLTWSRDTIGHAATAELALVAGVPTAAVVDNQGRARLMRYRDGWNEQTVEGRWRQAVPVAAGVIGLDPAGRVQLTDCAAVRPLWPGVIADELSAADTTLGGGRVDVVLRRGTTLLHGHGRATSWASPRPIVSRVWVAERSAPVHRR